jgi:long-chain acyl-CoA synthetase
MVKTMIDPMNTTFGELLLSTVAERPNSFAVSMGEMRLTYAELGGAVGALQAGLKDLGVRPGDRLALLFPNTPHFFIAFFAAQACGAEVVMCNCLHSPGEIAYVLNDSGARWLLALNVFDEKLAAVIPQCPGLGGVVVAGDTTLPGAASFDSLIRSNAGRRLQPVERSPESVAVIMYTSGTTGRSKGAMLSHRNLIFDAHAAGQTLDLYPTDVMIGILPLFHAYGFTVNLTLAVLHGLSVVLMPKFAATGALELMEGERVTVLAAVPTMYQMMLRTRRTPDYDISSLRIVVSGGAPLPLEVMTAFENRFGVAMLEGYGPTEASPVVSVNPFHGPRKVGSVGPPIPGTEVQVIDDEGAVLPVGQVGELCCKGPHVMLGYWNAPQATAETIVDGWLRTGDMARIDEDGYIYIVDRKKDMIIVGGMNVYPREVEDVIYGLPQIAECAVVGVPSTIKGEEVVAYISLKEGEIITPEQVIEHCRLHLAPFKVPREVVIEPELPKSPIGKVLRREVREMARVRCGR